MAVSSLTASQAVSTVAAYKPPTGPGAKYGAYVTTASLTVGDVIHMLKVPAGACIKDMTLAVEGMTSGAQLKVSVGDNGDRDRYFDSCSIATGTIYRLGDTAGNATGGLGYRYSAGSSTVDYVISVTVDTASSLSTSMTLKLIAEYETEQNW